MDTLRKLGEKLGVVRPKHRTPPWHQRRGIWITKDKREIPLYLLEDSHLANLFPFLHRWAQRKIQNELAGAVAFSCVLQEEHALDAIESEIDRISLTAPIDLLAGLPIYQALCDEADRRAARLGYVPAPGTWTTADGEQAQPKRRWPSRALTDREVELALHDGWGGHDDPPDMRGSRWNP